MQRAKGGKDLDRMVLYIGITVLCVLTAYQIQNHAVYPKGLGEASRRQVYNRICMACIFGMLFLTAACRYEVGNDYKRYLEFFRLISVGSYGDLPTEFGFNGIVKGMQLLFGSEIYLSIFALFAAVTILLMLRALYRLSGDFCFSFYLFMMFGYYFRSMNTVRYYVAFAAAMVSMEYVLKKQYGKFVLIILAASMVHKSVLLVLPVYFLANRVWKRRQIMVFIGGGILALVFRRLVLRLILILYPTYENTDLLSGGISIINILMCCGVLIFTLIYYKEAIQGDVQLNFYFNLNIFALILYTCCSFLPEVSRMGYYMTVGHIFLLPMMIGKISDRRYRRIWKLIIAVMAAVYFAAFLYTAYDPLIKLLPYKTWFFEERARLVEFGY